MVEELAEEQRTSREISNANLKPYVPGQSGNPGGMVKGNSITARLRKILDSEYKGSGRTVAEEIVNTIVKEVLNSTGKYGFNTALFKEILDRTEGKVKLPIGGEGEPIRIEFIPAKEK